MPARGLTELERGAPLAPRNGGAQTEQQLDSSRDSVTSRRGWRHLGEHAAVRRDAAREVHACRAVVAGSSRAQLQRRAMRPVEAAVAQTAAERGRCTPARGTVLARCDE